MADIKELYNRVFDENGNVRLCGREACEELIYALEEQTGIECGNEDTGMMDTEQIKVALQEALKEVAV